MTTYTADYLIIKRKEKWHEYRNIEQDRMLREAISKEILKDRDLLEEIRNNPEKLIELIFTVVDKEQNIVPFFFNEVQQDFIDILNNTIKNYNSGKTTEMAILILKGRQQGFTTLVTAYQLACTITKRNFQGLTLADESNNTETIFQNKAKYPYEQLPINIKPTERYNTKRQLLFEKINSSWSVDTATKNIGRSRTINFFHGSECAFWRDGISTTQAGLGEALTKNCIKIYESTANGFNDYEKMWNSNNYVNCFYEWWKTKEYRIGFESKEKREEFIYNIQNNEEWIYKRIKWLKKIKKLDINQLYWYYKKYTGYIDKRHIKQEYPCTPKEAFLTSGECCFDTEIITKRILEVKEPLKRGYFTYETYYDKEKKEVLIKNDSIKWKDDENGYIKIYKEPIKYYPYVLGGDTAGEGSDYFIGQVIDNITGEQVATLRRQFNSDLYAKQMYCLGIYYNKALISIEANYDVHPILELKRLRYPKQYVRKKIDTYTNKVEHKFGFRTDTITRPVIIDILIEIYRDHIHLINDKETLEEGLTFIRNEDGRPEALQGYHDDLTITMAITYYTRDQQYKKPIFNIEEQPDTIDMVKKEFGLTEKNKSSYVGMGDKDIII